MAGSDSGSGRFILRRTRSGTASATTGLPEHLQTIDGVKVLDASAHMVLVDAPRATLTRALEHYADWEIVPETQTPLPDTKVKLGRR